MSLATISIVEDKPYGTISPRLYGHFAEHLGRCCYDGLFVGKNSSIPNISGFRTDVIEALRNMPTPLLRWPGGCYADHYHWKDGVGENRPIRLGLSCGLKTLDTNELGTDEFLHLCELIGAEPYLAGNVGSGSPEELCHWVEYCNCELPTTLGLQRQNNGRKDPWNVKLWGIGNENWGCGGNYDPESYALEYRRYSLMVQHVDPSIEMVACGHDTDWNRRCIEKLKHHMNFVDHYSIHRYWIEGGHGTEFNESDYYALLDEAERTEEFIEETRAFLNAATGGKRKVGIALDEWGVWHPEARTWGPGPTTDSIVDYTQAGTMRDAIATAVGLEVFHRQCDSLSMANLAQIVNVLHAPIMTDNKGSMWVTPTYYVLQMHRCHLGATAYEVNIEGGLNQSSGKPATSATASSGGLTVTNRHLKEFAEVRVPDQFKTAVLLSSDQPNQQNSAENSAISPQPLAIESGRALLPPHSVATFFND